MMYHDTYNYVIFHKNCLDGFSGFFILHMSGRIEKDAQIYPDVPSAKVSPPNIENKKVIIIDCAYKYDVLRNIMEVAQKVTFIDHHVSISEDVKRLTSELNKNNIVVYNEKKSGASLTWEYLHPHKPLPQFVKFVEDNDIGAWKLKGVNEFITALEVNFNFDLTPNNMKKWKTLFSKKTISYLIKKGSVYMELKEYLLDINSKRYSMESFPSEKIYNEFSDAFKRPGQYKVAVFNGTGCPSTSHLGLRMMETIDCDFVILWSMHLDKKEYVLSFRSKEIDVGEIAKLFGGGGHKLASACSFKINKYSIPDLFYPMSLPRR